MDMTGEQAIPARRDAVWAALNDVDVLRQCIPGCEAIERISDTTMTARVALRVGPVKASFAGQVTLSDIDPPHGCRITGEGSGGVAGYAKGGAVVRLEQQGEATLLRYEARADVGGKIAQLGARLVESTARRLAGEFFEKFGEIVAGQAAAPPQPAAPPSPMVAAQDAPTGWLARVREWFSRLFGRRREIAR